MTSTESNSSTSAHKPAPSIQIVWQWVCYSLWEGALLALGLLLSITLSYFIVGTTPGQFAIYVLAAMVCLVPIAFFVDRMYARQEPAHKHGFAGVVMVLNAVLVFLVGMGGFIAAVVSALTMVVNGVSDEATIALISSIVVAGLGGMLFVRIVNPEKLRRFIGVLPWVMLAVSGSAVILAVIGPIRDLQATRDDRLIETNLPTVNGTIRSYAAEHDALPESLDDVTVRSYQDGAAELIDRQLVTYIPGDKSEAAGQQNSTNVRQLDEVFGRFNEEASRTTLNYQLCATFDKKKGNPGTKYDLDALYALDTNHPAGEVCYDLSATVTKR